MSHGDRLWHFTHATGEAKNNKSQRCTCEKSKQWNDSRNTGQNRKKSKTSEETQKYGSLPPKKGEWQFHNLGTLKTHTDLEDSAAI